VAQSGAELSNKIGEVIIKKTRFQLNTRGLEAQSVAEQSDICCTDQERFKSQIAAIMLAEMT
jgi:hypothetical protein